MVSFPYYSHSTPIRIPKDMGMVWEAYHKGVPSLGVPEISLEYNSGKRLPDSAAAKSPNRRPKCWEFSKPAYLTVGCPRKLVKGCKRLVSGL